MNSFTRFGVPCVLGILLSGGDLVGQNSARVPRTPDGRPDLQGFWTNGTITPLQRPPEFATKEFLTHEEAVQFERTALPRLLQGAQVDPSRRRELDYTYIDRLGLADGGRTSLIVDPANGRLPPRSAPTRGPINAETASSDAPETRTLDERCLIGVAAGSSSAAPPMVPNPINGNFYQIVQTSHHVMILSELIHDARIIRLDGTHPAPDARLWLGDSVGQWEGDTLVVDSTNFNDKRRWRGSTEQLHVVERFMRTDANTIRYHATIDDPERWSRPWVVDIPFKATNHPLFEYACHEGNYTLANILRGARMQDDSR
jgi:hypothetical protein